MKGIPVARAGVVAVVLTVIADLTVYGAAPGASYSVLVVAIVGGILLSRGSERRGFAAIVFCALLGGIAVQFVIQSSISGFFLGILFLIGLSFQTLEPRCPDPVGFLWRSSLSSLASIWNGIGEIAGVISGAVKKRIPVPRWWVIAVPVFLITLFGLMLANANPVFNKFIGTAWHSAWDKVVEILKHLNMERFLFWLLFFAGVYGIIRVRRVILQRGELKQPPLYVRKTDPKSEYLSCILSMASLNALFAIVNVIDVIYLWLSGVLPEGVTYAKYAHTGSYRLIVTVMISAVVVCAFYRKGTIQAQSLLAKMLVYLWVAQNMFLILSALRRLLIYIEAYGLTRWRVSVVFWVSLVLCGFILIIIKVAREWRAWRLTKANVITTLILFYVVGFLNIDGLIADYNVDRYLKGETRQMDVEYLASLDYNALPAIERLKAAPDPEVAKRSSLHLGKAFVELQRQSLDWRSYQWRRSRVLTRTFQPQSQ
jgi:hypothetical protein